MQIIHQPGLTQFQVTVTATGQTTIILAAANVRGIVINSVYYSWLMGAVSSSVGAVILSGTTFALHASINETNGPSGPINVQGRMMFEKSVQFPAGEDVRLSTNFSGGLTRLDLSIMYRTL